MKVRDIMTKDPAVCTADTTLQDAAREMCDRNCGEIPVVDDLTTRKPVGVITDRDITCRSVAMGKNPLELTVSECMTAPAVTVSPDMDVDECCLILAQEQIRRVPVVDENGRVCGIVAQADVVRRVDPAEAGEVVREVSLSA